MDIMPVNKARCRRKNKKMKQLRNTIMSLVKLKLTNGESYTSIDPSGLWNSKPFSVEIEMRSSCLVEANKTINDMWEPCGLIKLSLEEKIKGEQNEV